MDIKSQQTDPYLKIADDVCRFAVPTLSPPQGSAVQIMPWLQHFPTWFPGTYYANRAREAGHFVWQLYEYLYADVKRQLENGTAKPSFLATQLEELQSGEIEPGVTIEHIQSASAITYAAGAETVYRTSRWKTTSATACSYLKRNDMGETVYHEPFTYNPDRFLPQPLGCGELHSTVSFGFGCRRQPVDGDGRDINYSGYPKSGWAPRLSSLFPGGCPLPLKDISMMIPNS
ncbi:hypothetical protein DXG01_004085 [Tephrocybe rancida]|nr:hypothetical protein DXG01_004085 [Tephrocybe rancida]